MDWERLCGIGEDFTVMVEGAPDMETTFSIGDSPKEYELKEILRGVYQGRYLVTKNDDYDHAEISVHMVLKDEKADCVTDGLEVKKIWNKGRLTTDVMVPQIPIHVQARSLDKSVELKWGHPGDLDLAKYRVEKSDNPKSGYRLAGECGGESYTVKHLSNQKLYYFRVRSVDRNGNMSEPTVEVAMMPLPPGPTVFPSSGSTVKLFEASKPYYIPSSRKLGPSQKLTIEKGTIVKLEKDGFLPGERQY